MEEEASSSLESGWGPENPGPWDQAGSPDPGPDRVKSQGPDPVYGPGGPLACQVQGAAGHSPPPLGYSLDR